MSRRGPGFRMLDIGCGNLRAGRRFIDHLDAGHYYGIDISPDILVAAKRTVSRHGLRARFMEDWERRGNGQSKIRVSAT